jgi:hypothetical protein
MFVDITIGLSYTPVTTPYCFEIFYENGNKDFFKRDLCDK